MSSSDRSRAEGSSNFTHLKPVRRGRRLVYLRDLVRELVLRDIRLRYNRSVLGLAWSLIYPLMQVVVFYFLFRSVFPLDIPNYYLFVFCGLLVWGWFQSSLIYAAGALTENRELVRRPGFPVAVLPLITVLTNLVHFVLALPILFVFILFSRGPITGALFALPVLILLQLGLTLGLAYLVASVQVRFRDTQHLVTTLLLLLFYLSPVIYSASSIPEPFRPVYRLNPIVPLIDAYRAVLLSGSLPDGLSMLAVAVVAAVLFWLGHGVFSRARYSFAEEL